MVQCGMCGAALGFDCEQGGIGSDERFDLSLRCEQPLPLATVEGHGKATKAVDGQAALVGDFHGQALGLRLVCTELRNEGEELILGHGGEVGHGVFP